MILVKLAKMRMKRTMREVQSVVIEASKNPQKILTRENCSEKEMET